MSREHGAPSRYPQAPRCLQHWLRTVEIHGSRIALDCPEGTFDHASVAGRSAAVADRLAEAGLTGRRVAILTSQRSQAVVELLGVLLAGASIVPVDPLIPETRRNQMLALAGVAAVLESGELRLQPQSAEALVGEVSVFFTSGSTGVPKGVIGLREGLDHYVEWAVDAFGLCPQDVVAQLASVGFDAALKDVLPALCSGATLLIPSDQPYHDLPALAVWLTQSSATVLQTVPSVAAALVSSIRLREGTIGRVGRLRLLVLAGEQVTAPLIEEWKRLSGVDVWNLYGATETTIIKIAHKCAEGAAHDPVPVGLPLPGVGVKLCHPDTGLAVSATESGEIIVSTPFDLGGYLQPAESNAFQTDTSGRLREYRTGDFGRWGTGGVLVVEGRIDDQVKLSGARVEPAEIEAVLREAPRVLDCAVLVDRRGSAPALIAHVELAEGTDLTAVRQHLVQMLPVWSLPTEVTCVTRLPRLVSGKVDRLRLEQLHHSREEAVPQATPVVGERPVDHEVMATTGSVTEGLTQLWRELLNVDEARPTDNFFELGGNSLSMLRLIGRARKLHGVDIDIPDFYADPTLGGVLAVARESADHFKLVPADPHRRSFPLTPQQRMLWFLSQADPKSTAYTMVGRLRVDTPSEVTHLQAALDALVARHAILRTSFIAGENGPVQTVLDEADPVDIHVERGEFSNEQRRGVIQRLLDTHFDLEQPPLIRAIQLAGPTSEVYLAVHHIVADGESWRLMERELQATFRQLAMGGRPRTRPPELGYLDFAAWSLEEKSARPVAQTLHWWDQTLGPELPKPWPTGCHDGTAIIGDVHESELDVDVSAAITDCARQAAVSEFTVFLAAWASFQTQQSGDPRVVVVSDTTDRSVPETETMLGYFVATILVPLQVDPQDTFTDLVVGVGQRLAAVRTTHQIPLDELLRHRSSLRAADGAFPVRVMVRSTPNRAPLPSGIHPEPKIPVAIALSGGLDGGAAGARVTLETDRRYVPEHAAATLLRDFVEHLRGCLVDPQATAWSEDEDEDEDRPQSSHGETFTPIARFLARAAKHDRQVAITISGGRELTYGELADRVEVLRRALREAGLRPGDRVLCRPLDGLSFVVVLLACLVERWPIVPVSPATPSGRLSLIKTMVAPAIEVLNESTFTLTDPSTEPPPLPEGAAAIFFTSGTSGSPKAVVASRDSIAHFIDWYIEEFRFTRQDASVLTADVGFDAVLRDVLAPLSVGASLLIPGHPEDDVEAFFSALDEHKVSVLNTVPSRLQAWLAAEATAELRCLRLLCLAGEPLHGELLDVISARFPQSPVEVVNLYGPTETTMVKTFYRVRTHDRFNLMPVGRPLPGTAIALVNENGETITRGEGAILIDTPDAALGYLEFTAAEEPTARTRLTPLPRPYPTGDIGHLSPDGLLVVTGRSDDQIKVNGVRVHPSETKAVIASLTEVQDVAVIPRLADGTPGLRAFVVATDDKCNQTSLRAACGEVLAGPAIPREFVFVDRLPLTPNGKTDYRALIALPDTRPSMREPHNSDPREESTLLEPVLAVWRDVLSAPNLGPDDEFYEHGGHSLLAPAMVARLKRAVGLAVPLRLLMQNTTARACADALAGGASESSSVQITTVSTGTQATVIAVPPAHGLSDRYRGIAARHPGLAWHLVDVLEPPDAGWGETVDLVERVARESAGRAPVVLLGWSAGGVVAAQAASRLCAEQAQPNVRLLLIDSAAPGSPTYQRDPGKTDWRRDFLRDVAHSRGWDNERLEALLPASRIGQSDLVRSFGAITGANLDPQELITRISVFRGSFVHAAQVDRLDLENVPARLVVANSGELSGLLGPDLGWRDATSFSGKIVTAAGGHHDVLDHGAEVIDDTLRELVR